MGVEGGGPSKKKGANEDRRPVKRGVRLRTTKRSPLTETCGPVITGLSIVHKGWTEVWLNGIQTGQEVYREISAKNNERTRNEIMTYLRPGTLKKLHKRLENHQCAKASAGFHVSVAVSLLNAHLMLVEVSWPGEDDDAEKMPVLQRDGNTP